MSRKGEASGEAPRRQDDARVMALDLPAAPHHRLLELLEIHVEMCQRVFLDPLGPVAQLTAVG